MSSQNWQWDQSCPWLQAFCFFCRTVLAYCAAARIAKPGIWTKKAMRSCCHLTFSCCILQTYSIEQVEGVPCSNAVLSYRAADMDFKFMKHNINNSHEHVRISRLAMMMLDTASMAMTWQELRHHDDHKQDVANNNVDAGLACFESPEKHPMFAALLYATSMNFRSGGILPLSHKGTLHEQTIFNSMTRLSSLSITFRMPCFGKCPFTAQSNSFVQKCAGKTKTPRSVSERTYRKLSSFCVCQADCKLPFADWQHSGCQHSAVLLDSVPCCLCICEVGSRSGLSAVLRLLPG